MIFIFRRYWVFLGIILGIVSCIWSPLSALFLPWCFTTLIGLIVDVEIEQKQILEEEELKKLEKPSRIDIIKSRAN